MPTILDGRNWEHWKANFLCQLWDAGLQYLLMKNPINPVEKTDSSDSSHRQPCFKDQEAARRLLYINLDSFFQTIVSNETTLYEAYQLLEDMCAPDPYEAAYEEYKEALQSPILKDKTILQSWLYFSSVHGRCFSQVGTEKDEEIKKEMTFRQFLYQLPAEYKEVIIESTRKNLEKSKTIILLENVRKSILDKGNYKKTKKDRPKVKCSNCKKKGHAASVCWSKKSNSDQKTTQLADQDTQSKYSECQNWIIDTGCSWHMTNDPKLLQNAQDIRETIKWRT